MLKRFLPLLAVLALVGPAAAVADGPAKPSGEKDPGARLATIEQRIDARFHAFATHCLVDKAPTQCVHIATRFVQRLGKVQGRIDHIESRINEKCSQPTPPARCAHAADLISRLDALRTLVSRDFTS